MSLPLTVATTFTVIGTGTNGCTNKATVTQNVVSCTGLEKIAGSLQGLLLYPNPTNGMFTVELKNNFAKTVEVMDLTGRVIASKSAVDQNIDVDINGLSNGVYFVKIKSQNETQVIKVVKQ